MYQLLNLKMPKTLYYLKIAVTKDSYFKNN
jgi:hypothetical protein